MIAGGMKTADGHSLRGEEGGGTIKQGRTGTAKGTVPGTGETDSKGTTAGAEKMYGKQMKWENNF